MAAKVDERARVRRRARSGRQRGCRADPRARRRAGRARRGALRGVGRSCSWRLFPPTWVNGRGRRRRLSRAKPDDTGTRTRAVDVPCRSCGGAALEAIALDWLFFKACCSDPILRVELISGSPFHAPKTPWAATTRARCARTTARPPASASGVTSTPAAATRSASSRTAAPTRASSSTRAAAPAC